MRVALIALAAGGCWSGTHGGTTTATPGGHDAPLGPPPTVAWHDDAPQITGLPAVSADGSVVMFAQESSDPGRGFSNLAFVTVSRTDQPVARENAITAGGDEPPAKDVIDAQLAKANAYLVAQNAARHFVPMHVFPEPQNTDDGPAMTMGDAGVTVTWDGTSALSISVDGKVVVATKTPKTWLAEDRPMYNGAPPEDTCSNPAHLGGGAIDRAHKIVYLVVRYHGTDSCWEPNDQLHVVSW